MSSHSPMSREELLDLAALDALGLLDQYEAALYTRSFHHAPVSVQNEVRRMQAETAGDDAILPDVEPPLDLRERVLKSVANAIEEESAEFAPLAMIGRGRNASSRRDTIGRIGFGATRQGWRAASFVLAAVLLVMLYVGGQKDERNDQVQLMAIDLLAHAQVRDLIQRERESDLVPDLFDFIGQPTCERINLTSPSSDGPLAVVYRNRKTGEAFVFTMGLAENTRYTLRGAFGNEAVVTRQIIPTGPMAAAYLGKITVATLSQLTFTVTTAASGKLVLSTHAV